MQDSIIKTVAQKYSPNDVGIICLFACLCVLPERWIKMYIFCSLTKRH